MDLDELKEQHSELTIEFEEEFSIEIPDEDAENITTVSSAVKYIDEHK